MGLPSATVGVITVLFIALAILFLFSLRDFINDAQRNQRSRTEARPAHLYDNSDTELGLTRFSTSTSPVSEAEQAHVHPPRTAEEFRRTASRPGVMYASSRLTATYDRWDVAGLSPVSDSRSRRLSTISSLPPYASSDEIGLPRYDSVANPTQAANNDSPRLPAYESNPNRARETESVGVSDTTGGEADAAAATTTTTNSRSSPRPFPLAHPEVAVPMPARTRGTGSSAAHQRAEQRERALERRYHTLMTAFPRRI